MNDAKTDAQNKVFEIIDFFLSLLFDFSLKSYLEYLITKM